MTTSTGVRSAGRAAVPDGGAGSAPPSPLAGRPGRVLVVLAALGALVGVVAGLLSGPLWLDEAQSVAIARLPLAELPQALREDGAPPLYYLLLHAWIGVAGESAVAVRLPSAVLGAVALVLVHVLGRRLESPLLGRVALIVLAGLPWFSYYSAETRMYLLVVVLVELGALALLALRARPSAAAFGGVAACTAALLLTHYWSLFLLTVVGLWHLRGLLGRSAVALRVVGAMAAGSLAFLPWLPSFLYQSAHTGAPWAGPASLEALLRSTQMWANGPLAVQLYLGALYLALLVHVVRAPGTGRLLAALTAATLVLAWVSTAVAGGAYVGRYTAVVVPLLALALAIGVLRLPPRWQVPALAAVVLPGLVVGGLITGALRTQGGEVADALAATAAPGDVVVFCPDQLGPSVTRPRARRPAADRLPAAGAHRPGRLGRLRGPAARGLPGCGRAADRRAGRRRAPGLRRLRAALPHLRPGLPAAGLLSRPAAGRAGGRAGAPALGVRGAAALPVPAAMTVTAPPQPAARGRALTSLTAALRPALAPWLAVHLVALTALALVGLAEGGDLPRPAPRRARTGGGPGTPGGTAPSPATATPGRRAPRTPTCASSRCSRCSAGCSASCQGSRPGRAWSSWPAGAPCSTSPPWSGSPRPSPARPPRPVVRPGWRHCSRGRPCSRCPSPRRSRGCSPCCSSSACRRGRCRSSPSRACCPERPGRPG
jgi:hypothetical protein